MKHKRIIAVLIFSLLIMHVSGQTEAKVSNAEINDTVADYKFSFLTT